MPRPSRAMSREPFSNRTSVLQIVWAVALVLLLSGLPLFTTAQAQEATPGAASESAAGSHLDAAVAWLLAQQDAGGGFLGFNGELDAGVTTDAVLALAAAGDANPNAAAALESAVMYLEAEGSGYASSGAGQAAKVALAAVAGGRDPRSFGGTDLLAAIAAPPTTSVQHPVSGIYGDDLYDHALALLALAAAGEPVSDEQIAPLRDTQGADGGWAFDGSTEPGVADSNTTALVLQALAATGHGDDPMVAGGLQFLSTLLASDGSGVAYGPAETLVADANSTALALQAVIAAGADPAAPDWGNLPLALARFQLPDGGVRYMSGDVEANLLATLQAIPAMAGVPLPIAIGCAADVTAGTDGCILLAPAA